MDGFLGEIRTFAFTFVPRGWMACNGNILPIQQYSALFSILGVQYGGNGTTNFALPNYQGSGPVSQGQGPGLSNWTVGEQTGTESVTLLQSQMPAHNHIIHNKVIMGNAATPAMRNVPSGIVYLSRQVSPIGTPQAAFRSPPLTSPTTLNPGMIGISGGSSPHENRQPYLPMLVCICISGVFPSRN